MHRDPGFLDDRSHPGVEMTGVLEEQTRAEPVHDQARAVLLADPCLEPIGDLTIAGQDVVVRSVLAPQPVDEGEDDGKEHALLDADEGNHHETDDGRHELGLS